MQHNCIYFESAPVLRVEEQSVNVTMMGAYENQVTSEELYASSLYCESLFGILYGITVCRHAVGTVFVICLKGFNLPSDPLFKL